jgi:large subunit ribosomal protein L17
MRHQKAGRKLGRKSAHRKAMFSNMLASLVIHERVETTDAKAKELKRIADRTISWGTSVGDLTAKGRAKLDAAEKARVVHAMRMAGRELKSADALTKLFDEVAPRFRGRTGGYTRVLKTRVRVGDAAPMSFVELVGRELPADTGSAAPEGGGKKKAAKGAAAEGEAKPKRKSKKSEEATA